jgi:fructokinase
MSTVRFAAVETGGSKILCRVTDGAGEALAEARFATTTPADALAELDGFIASALLGGELHAVGLASFGPLVVDPAARDYGYMAVTPKPHWSGSNLRQALEARLGVRTVVDTDVNAAALAESRDGAGKGIEAVAYVTVGTGVGGGLCVRGRTLHGASHPEIGHLRLHRAPGDVAASACVFHHDCVEGLVSGPAGALRLGAGERQEDRPDLRDQTAGYLAELCRTLTLAWAPGCIILGGGVLHWPGLLAAVQAKLAEAAGGYGPLALAQRPDFLRRPAFTDSGLEGALMMARAAAHP